MTPFLSRLTRCCLLIGWMAASLPAEPSLRQMLSGTGSDKTVPWEFKLSGGRRGGVWTTIPVPSNWEMQGFGSYKYWKDWGPEETPDRMGWYRHGFQVPMAWKGKRIDLVFGGVMTDAEVKINGRLVGPVHQGGFYEFRYDVTEFMDCGKENRLEVAVQRFSADASVNQAERKSDYWLFSGIYRPVWLEAHPVEHIEQVAIDAKHDGRFSADLTLAGLKTVQRITAQIRTMEGKAVGNAFTTQVGASTVRIQGQVNGIEPWSAEYPRLYSVEFKLEGPTGEIHRVSKTFGFRTIEVRRGLGLFVNGKPVRLRGTNRHTFWPTTGRATNETLSEQDVQLIKGMNMNAVRMSHYPPDPHFLDAADRLGLYVIDELAGWQAAYDTTVGRKLVGEMVRRDVNHPSIILWANGNEGGWNTDLDGDYRKHDPQNRTVIHPWADFNGINTSHYESYNAGLNWFFGGDELLMPTEFLHGLYDGGAGAGLDDWWNLMMRHPLAVGGFIWAFADEGIVREDQGGKIDVRGNLAPDGVVGPYREREGSYYAIKKIWSPVYLPMGELNRVPPAFAGELRVENRYDFTNLREVRFAWKLIDFPLPNEQKIGHRVAAEGPITSPDVAPRMAGALTIPLPPEWSKHDALVLSAVDREGRDIYTWTWMIARASGVAQKSILVPASGATVSLKETNDGLLLKAGDTEVIIDRATGQLVSAKQKGDIYPLCNGPRILSGSAKLISLRHFVDGPDQVVEAAFDGTLQKVQWRLAPDGWLRMDVTHRYAPDSQVSYPGVTFDFQEKGVTGMRWLGRGPFRVWKNRLKGVEFDVWSKTWNDTATGASWKYPEFKGFHSNVYWAELEGAKPVTLVFASDDLFLRLFTPAEGPEPKTSHVDFPAGDLSILHGIAPIGTKFHAASDHGPEGQPYLIRRHGLSLSDTVYFHFGKVPHVSTQP